MPAKRYAVADKDGKIINHILVEDPLPKGYWPGYGAYLLPLEAVDTSGGGGGLDVIKFDKWVNIPQIGDTVNLATGEVTKFVAPKNADGEALAPEVKLVKEEEPKPDGGTVTEKVSTAEPKVVAEGGKAPK